MSGPRRAEGNLSAWLAVVVLANLVLCVYLPVGTVLLEALRQGGAEALRRAACAFAEPRREGLLVRSLGIALTTSILALLLGLPVSLLVTRSDLRRRGLIRGLVLLPLLLPTYVFAVGWQHAFDQQGCLAWLVPDLRGTGSQVPQLGSPLGVALLLGLRFFPIAVFILSAGFARLEPAREDAARLVHRTPWILAHITLPLNWRHVLLASLLIFNLSLADYTVPSLLQVPTYPMEVFAEFSGMFNTERAIVLAVPLLLSGVVLVFLTCVLMGPRPLSSWGDRAANVPLLRLGRWRAVVLGVVLFAIGSIVAVPLFSTWQLMGDPSNLLRAYTLASKQVWTTCLLAGGAATLLTFLGTIAGYHLSRGAGLTSRLAAFLFFFPLAVPATVLGIGMIRFWNTPHLAGMTASPLVLLLVYSGRFFPYALAPMLASMHAISTELEDAARVAGMRRILTWHRVLLPLCRPGMIAAWVITFCLCLDEVGATILVTPPGVEVLGARIYNLTHYDAMEMVGGLCWIVILIVCAAGAIAGLLLRLGRVRGDAR